MGDDQLITVQYGVKKLEPVPREWKIERHGWFRWRWTMRTPWSLMRQGPFWTRAGAERSMAETKGALQ